jgi:hypothetical protein
MYHYRQVLVRMRQGDSDRDIDRSRIMGRKKLALVRETAIQRGWFVPGRALPDDAELAKAFGHKQLLPASNVSSAEPWRAQIAQWVAAGVTGTTIHSALARNHGYGGSYTSVYRMIQQIRGEAIPEVPMRLEFKPSEAAQVDFGAGPTITDVHTGEVHKTWFFVMTLCWSRPQYVEVVRDQTIASWLQCHRHAFEWFNGVASRVIIDNPKCAIVKACIHEPEVQRAYAQCADLSPRFGAVSRSDALRWHYVRPWSERHFSGTTSHPGGVAWARRVVGMLTEIRPDPAPQPF